MTTFENVNNTAVKQILKVRPRNLNEKQKISQ